MTTVHTALVLVHILGAVGIFAAEGIAHTSVLRPRRARTVADMRLWAEVGDGAKLVFIATELMILTGGVGLATIDQLWRSGGVDVALVATLILMAAGPAINGRKLGAMLALARNTADGPVTPVLVSAEADPVYRIAADVTLLATIGLVVLMVLKPGLAGSLAVLAGSLVMGATLGMVSQRAPALSMGSD